MKKIILFAFSCLLNIIVFAQSGQTLTDEMSSQWITVGIVVSIPVTRNATAAKKVTVRPGKKVTVPKPSPSPKPVEVFNKTNTQVKRFKKTSG